MTGKAYRRCELCGAMYTVEHSKASKQSYTRRTCTRECGDVLRARNASRGKARSTLPDPTPEEIAERAAEIRNKNLERMRAWDTGHKYGF